jgi:hypothetical protein
MMICPETFYEEHLKGKTAAQIMTVIRGLKQEIGRLKNIVEHPDYECTMHPSERVRISCNQEYLKRAKLALAKTGGMYTLSVAERKSIEFDDNIQYINKVIFSIGGYFSGYETKTCTFVGDEVHILTKHSLKVDPLDLDDSGTEKLSKEDFLEQFKSLHIGEWRKNYNTKRFGYFVCDGTQWELEIYYDNERKPVKITGENAYPHNFDQLLELFEIDTDEEGE